MRRRRTLGDDLGTSPLQGSTVWDHPRTHRLTGPTTETEVHDVLKGLIHLKQVVTNRVHRLEPPAG